MEIREYTYSDDEMLSLYNDAGWTAYTKDLSVLRKAFEDSLIVLAAYDNSRLMGVIRAVGDGATIVFVQDILVFKQYQRKGVGTALLKEVLGRYRNVRQIGLVTDNTPETIAFYESVGFKELSKFGCCGFMHYNL